MINKRKTTTDKKRTSATIPEQLLRQFLINLMKPDVLAQYKESPRAFVLNSELTKAQKEALLSRKSTKIKAMVADATGIPHDSIQIGVRPAVQLTPGSAMHAWSGDASKIVRHSASHIAPGSAMHTAAS